MKKYQQGDVLFKEVSKDQWNIEEKNKDILNEETKLFEKRVISVMRPTKNNQRHWVIEEETGRLEKEDDYLTVAFGEVTGHSHTFRNQPSDINIISYGIINTSVGETPKYVNIEGGTATITHEEHKPLDIAPGHYRVSIVREWDHIGEFSRSVVD